ncbi:aldo/keto reductase [Nocardia farcinica]|uniref:aldo/keto reductase n=1 Tax=Nocardia farcinica TaxID=37329 RepID=UPI0018938AB0|nr:aldo/keto reductase [Nocardia farcinica]MBF6420160.1 aldo/keto reductase [Nocardia farcinica]MBF6432336.1 aldo/keto reductase [Nocardia farcinica]MBF6504905.1 aldo/keto reductase [Nocardia farcinica]
MTFRSETSAVPSIVLNDGNVIPQLGFGVFQVPPDDVFDVVTTALRAGYRSIDTAAVYGNEEGTGRAIRAFGLPRDEVYVTTKLWNSEQGYDSTLRAFDDSMSKLGLDYLDLYLIHWPVAAAGKFVDTFRAFQELKRQGRVRSIGVSNFTVDNLRTLIAETGEIPAVNQIELHPALAQRELREFHAENAIATEAWSPLGQGTLLEDDTITRIAQEVGRTPAQVIIRWHLQLGNVVIPKSVTPARIEANFDVFGFELSREQMAAIDGLDRGGRIGPDPDTFSAGL